MRSSERLVALGGVGLAVASVVPWYTPDQLAYNATRTNGWQDPDALLSQLGVIAGVLLTVVVLVASRQPQRPAVAGVSWGAFLTVGGLVSFGAVLLKLSLNLDGTTVGIYLALVAGLTQLYGGYVTYLEQRPSPTATPPRHFAPAGAGPVPPGPTPEPQPPPTRPAAPPVGATWPETAYFLQAWARPGSTIQAAVAAYRQAFAADQPRQLRLLGEVQALGDPHRGETERYELLATFAPAWAGWPAHQVFTELARALAEGPAPR
jgi:hypothetical protein